MTTRSSGLAFLVLVVGCGGGGGGTDGPRNDGPPGPDADPNAPDADPNAPDADPNAPDAAPWETLISAQWTLGAGEEGYFCATKTMTEDVYSHVLRAMAPLGTHHTVIDIGPPSGPDNPGYPCGPSFGEFWASGVGTPTLTLPDGVGLLAAQGQQLTLSLHLFNASDAPLSGTSGLEAQRMDPGSVVHTASVSYHGPFSFAIPGNGTPYTSTHTTSLGDRTLIAIFPHMHQLGTHFRARIIGGAGATLWDEDYQFESQEFSPLPEIPITSSQELETQCTWVNTTGSTVFWGDSSNAEMCFTILMSY
jgi:hypothetical protein